MRRGEFGTLGPDGNCWPQMACTVPSLVDKVIRIPATFTHPNKLCSCYLFIYFLVGSLGRVSCFILMLLC